MNIIVKKDFALKSMAAPIRYIVEVKEGFLIEKNCKSPTGYYVSPNNFPENSIERHDATYYGFIIPKKYLNKTYIKRIN